MRDHDVEEPPTPGVPPDEVFAALGNETRLAILRVLWEAQTPGEMPSEARLTFSELRERVAVADSGQFNYHLNKLLDRFVDHTDDGYCLRAAGQEVVRAVLKGTLTEDATLEEAPVEATCPNCGADVSITYREDRLFFVCSDCEGSFGHPGVPHGTLTGFPIPATVLLDRTPEEVFRQATTWSEHRQRLMMEGVCPECAGTVAATPAVCDDHGAETGEVCETCRSAHPVTFLHVCSVCKYASWLTPWLHAFTDPRVEAFYSEHGFDSFGPDYFHIWPATVERQTVVAEDPLELQVVFAVDDDRLEVTLDETGQVVEVLERR